MRLLIIFLSIALLGNAGAATFGLYTYEINPDNVSVTITNYPKYATGAIEIPAIINGRSVTRIGDEAFSTCSLTRITIPDSVTSIGDKAFSQCIRLTSITIRSGVTSIGDAAFAHCASLTRITIPNSVTSIGDHAFYYCKNLASIVFESMVAPTIGSGAFFGISYPAIIQYPLGATGYAASYDNMPTAEEEPALTPDPKSPVLDIGLKKTISDFQTLSHDYAAELSTRLLNCKNPVARKHMPDEAIHDLTTAKLSLVLLRR